MITIADLAAEKIKQILTMEGLPNHALRVAASGGCGCGPQYEIMIDDKAGDDDTIVEKNGAKLFVDANTAKIIDGAELSFISDARGEGFVLGFPNGLPPKGGSCGCGGGETPNPSSGGGCGTGGCACG